MKRRLFLKFSLLAALAARTSHSALASVLAPSTEPVDRLFIDERFEEARAMAARLAPGVTPTPVQSDVTALWIGELSLISGQRSFFFQGVTTESFHFCLKTLLRSGARVETQARRVSKDLHAWSIRTTLIESAG